MSGSPALLGPSSLLQTTLPGETGAGRAALRAPRLDALVRRPLEAGFALDHHHRAQGRPDRGWVLGATLSLAATAPGALAQRPGRPGWSGRPRWRHGALEALVPEAAGVVHLTRDHGADGLPAAWARRGVVAARADAVALVAHGSALEALVADAGRIDHLRHTDAGGWRVQATLTADATGPPALARIPGGALVAAVPGPGGVHGWRLDADGAWRALGLLSPREGVPALAPTRHGVLLGLGATGPDAGVHLLVGAADQPGPWTPAGSFADAGVPALALAATALGDGLDLSRLGLGVVNAGGLGALLGRPSGWVQALVQEGPSLYHWHHQRADGRWARAACLRHVDPRPALVEPEPSAKVAQLSGERDSQPWPGGPRPTLSASESTSGVRGTDLGVRVDHAGRGYLLFGDTHWRRRSWATRDSIAALEPAAGPGLPRATFHGAPLHLAGGATMREYDVPLDAFGLGDDWFVFASSHHFARHQVMGRSVLARALDDPARLQAASRRPFRLRTLATVSDWRFVNLSCQWVAAPPGVAADGDVLALWGSGSYRADDLRLAVFDPWARSGRLRTARRLATADLGLRYFGGSDAAGGPVWVDREADAAPVVPGAFGEISVRWVPELAAFALLAMTGPDDPAGAAVVLRTSPTPWGPWSPRRVLLDWIADGLSFGDPARRWIRAGVDDDPVGDRVFRLQASMGGGAYAPYLFDSRPDGPDVLLRYTLSTWNPYQVVLLEHRLRGARRAGTVGATH